MEDLIKLFWEAHSAEVIALAPVVIGAEVLSRWGMMFVMLRRPKLSEKMQKMLGSFTGMSANVFLSTAFIFTSSRGSIGDIIVKIFYFSGIAAVGHLLLAPVIEKLKRKK
jgi:hypothetical protein